MSTDTKKLSLKELMDIYDGLQHRIAVVDMLLEFLNPYLPDDNGVAQQTLTDRRCRQPIVSTDAVDAVWVRLRRMREEFESELKDLDNVEIELGA